MIDIHDAATLFSVFLCGHVTGWWLYRHSHIRFLARWIAARRRPDERGIRELRKEGR